MDLTREAYRKIMEHLPQGIYIVDRSKTIVFWNRAAEAISGYSQEEVVGHSCADNMLCHVDSSGITLCNGTCPISLTLNEGNPLETEIYLHHKSGHRVPVAVSVAPLHDDDGDVVGSVMSFTDLSGRAENDLRIKELEKLALLDRLTQLANRHYLERELDARLEELRRYDVPFGVMFMDIDGFKQVNDNYGHDIGDRVLQFVAGTLSSNSRPFDLYGRWGGEEFVGIVRNVTPVDVKHMAQRMRRLVEKSFLMIDGAKLQVTISVGATLATESDSIPTLIQRADTLMYQSKSAGKNRVTYA